MTGIGCYWGFPCCVILPKIAQYKFPMIFVNLVTGGMTFQD